MTPDSRETLILKFAGDRVNVETLCIANSIGVYFRHCILMTYKRIAWSGLTFPGDLEYFSQTGAQELRLPSSFQYGTFACAYK